jgi:hypothetical protein
MRHFLAALLTIATLCSFGQASLQFNQVIYLSYTGTQTPSATTPTVTFQNTAFTVPAGKCWKIESANVALHYPANSGYMLKPSTTNSSVNGTFLLVDNVVMASQVGNNLAGKVDSFSTFPVWLPAGTYGVHLMGQYANEYGTWTAYGNISVIEFNIVP